MELGHDNVNRAHPIHVYSSIAKSSYPKIVPE
jgi:hypothetical protein